MNTTENSLQNSSPDQGKIWKGAGGQGWVVAQTVLDQMFKPLEGLLVDAVLETSAQRVLDVGCGTGATTVAIARHPGVNANCIGIDISEVMVEAARARADREGVAANFICADAQTHGFDVASVDLIVSRFGVMFFDDPVQAFANLRSATSPGAGMRCIVWRSAAENPFMTAAEQAAESLLPGVSRRVPNEPGQFGLADSDRVRDILARSGWRQIEVAAIDVPCAFPVSELELYLSLLGPVGRALQSEDSATRARVIEAVRPAFNAYLHGHEVRFTAALWMISAHVQN